MMIPDSSAPGKPSLLDDGGNSRDALGQELLEDEADTSLSSSSSCSTSSSPPTLFAPAPTCLLPLIIDDVSRTSRNCHTARLTCLPTELLQIVCCFVPAIDLLSVGSVCTRLNGCAGVALLKHRGFHGVLPIEAFNAVRHLTCTWSPCRVMPLTAALVGEWRAGAAVAAKGLLAPFPEIFRPEQPVLLPPQCPAPLPSWSAAARRLHATSAIHAVFHSSMSASSHVLSLIDSSVHPSALTFLQADVKKFCSFSSLLTNLLLQSIHCEAELGVLAVATGLHGGGSPTSRQFSTLVSNILELAMSLVSLGHCFPQYSVPNSHDSEAITLAMGDFRFALLRLIERLAGVNCRDLCMKARQVIRMIRFRYRVHCLGCGQREQSLKELKVCACCKVGTYCGPACQRQDWENHRVVCTFVSSFKSS